MEALEIDGASPERQSYFPIHSTGFDVDDGLAYIPNGDLTIHVRITDPDYDVSAAGQDVIEEDGEGPLSVFIKRGSETYELGTAGGSDSTFGAIQEIAPDAGVFEVDITIRYNDGPMGAQCPSNDDMLCTTRRHNSG